MKVLVADLDREWRGGQSQFFLMLRGFRETGIEAELVAPRGSPLAQRAAAMGTPVHEVSGPGLQASAALTLRGLTKREEFQLLHVNEAHALTSGWLARAHRRMPLLFSRRVGFPLRKNLFSNSRFSAVARFVANCVFVERILQQSGIAPPRISIVHEGVEMLPPAAPEIRREAREAWGVRGGEFLLGCVSVFVPTKGQEHLIRALAQVRAEYPQARLLLAGDGPLRREMEQLAAQMGQAGAVIFPGFVRDIARLHAALDAFVFPSEFEAMGTALMDAMALGLPAISTTCGGLAEVVENERNALAAAPNEGDFAAAMRRLISDQPLRERLGAAARRTIHEKFTADRMVRNTIRVYESVSASR